MPRYLSKVSILSYIVNISIQEIEEHVKDRRECCKTAAMRCCLSLKISEYFRGVVFWESFGVYGAAYLVFGAVIQVRLQWLGAVLLF